jgi:lysozyme
VNTLRAIDDLIRDEGERLSPYFDNAVPPRMTIGVGRNLTDRGISKEESRYLLQNDIDSHSQALDRFLPWWTTLDEVRQRALFNMCFNLGIAGLLGFKNMLEALQHKDWAGVSRHARSSTWFAQVGLRAVRIVYMFETGKDP